MVNEKRLIYMDDTMDRLRAYAERKHQAGHTELANGILKAVNYIHNEISRVDAVEVVHGHWIEHPNAEMHNGKWVSNYECSECCCFYRTHENYCGYCGAKMDGDGNG